MKIENMDFRELIDKYDDHGTFFYLDPPYPVLLLPMVKIMVQRDFPYSFYQGKTAQGILITGSGGSRKKVPHILA